MNSLVLRTLARRPQSLRFLSSASVPVTGPNSNYLDHQGKPVPQSAIDQAFPGVGNRDIVGHGWNGGIPMYHDLEDWPFPSCRFQENTPEAVALREKAKGDWHNLTLEEKKGLYRADFCSTYSEIKGNGSVDWKGEVASVITLIGLSFLWLMYVDGFVFRPKDSMHRNPDKERREIKRMVQSGIGFIDGPSSMYDYDKKEWK